MNPATPGQLYWSRVEPYWLRLNETWEDPAQFLATMKSVPNTVQNLYAAHWCVSEVLNGGLHQFFYNTTGILAPEAAIGLASVGATELSQLVSEGMRFFGSSYPRDRKVRLDQLPELDDETELEGTAFSPLDEKFNAWLDAEEHRWERLADRYAADA